MSYVKAIHPYQTGVVGDLQLQVGDVVEIVEQVDDNWLRGRLKEQIGLVPCQFVEYLPGIELAPHQSLYRAHTDYQSSHEGDLSFYRGNLLIVDEHLSNGWLRGSLHFDLPGTTFRPNGIFPNTFVTLIRKQSQNSKEISSQNDLSIFDANPVKFVRVICDIKPTESNELSCFEDEILAVIEDNSPLNEWLIVKNRFNSIGRVKRRFIESIDEKQIDDERNELLIVPTIKSNSNPFDSLNELISKEFDPLHISNSSTPFPSTSHVPATIYNSSQLISPYAFGSNYNNSNNNNNILDAQSFYTSVPLNHFSTILTATKPIGNVCHTPSSTSSLSSFDEPPPVKPRLSLRPQLPPPPPPPFVPTFSSSIPQFRGPTRPAPKPPVQQQPTFQINPNPFEKSLCQDETNSTRDSCDVETSSTRTDFFDIELQNLHNQLLIDDPIDKTDTNVTQRRRQHVISELVSTERDYVRDLDLLIETFLNPSSISCPESVNKTLLFGNLRDIAELSRHLLRLLECEYNKSQQGDDAHCCIGQVVNGLIDRLKTVYAEYCRNHEWVHGYLRQHSNDEKLQQYLQDGLCRIRLQKANIFDISALLLRPIQRIVRYPLILNELFKNTSIEHLDSMQLKEAISNLISMATYINEFKRRKEIVSKYQRRDKDEALTNKLYKLNMHTMRKKSARISMRLSNAFGLAAHTIDERFNFEEQRFRAIEKFLRLFVRNAYICMEALKETFVTQVNVAEDFEELLSDKMPELAQQFVRSKRTLLENAFTEFCTQMESCVANPINTLIKLFVLPSNLIAKRHDKLLDYDGAQSAFEKAKEPQARQAKQVLELAKKTYEALNSQLLEELPVLYEHSCQILAICLKAFISGHLRLFQHMRTNIQYILAQTTSPTQSGQLSWLQIVERFTLKNNPTAEQIFQLTITAKNFSDKLKHFSAARIASLMNNVYSSDKDITLQNDEIRRLLRNRYTEKDLYTVIRDYASASNDSTTEIFVRSGDLVAVVNQTGVNWLVDNGITRALLPRTILIPLSSGDRSGFRSHTPPTPLRHDLGTVSTRASLPTSHAHLIFNTDQSRHGKLQRTNTVPAANLINSSVDLENERIYLNQINECHQYASIDFGDSTLSESNGGGEEEQQQQQIYVAMYDFECTSEGVLSLQAGERLKILRRLDDGGNDDWWYVEKIDRTKQRGYVPANYIQTA